jgi:hypothetical protein
MSGIGGKAENICSFRVLLNLTRGRHRLANGRIIAGLEPWLDSVRSDLAGEYEGPSFNAALPSDHIPLGVVRCQGCGSAILFWRCALKTALAQAGPVWRSRS